MRRIQYFVLLLLAVGRPVWAARPAEVPQIPASAADFVENRGQWPAAVRFAAALHSGKLFAEAAALTYVLATDDPTEPPTTAGPHAGASLAPQRAQAYRVQFVGSAAAAVVGQQPTGVAHSYFTGDEAATQVGGAAGFGRVQYTALYPDIDLAVYANPQAQLEYTFTVQPGGQPAAVRLHYAGVAGLRVDGAGCLQLQLPIGSVTELAPVAWQTDPATGQRRPVACAFQLVAGDVGFELGAYDPTRPLIIDPVVLFATFTGSRADNWGHTATYDAQGNFYSAGTVFNYGYPASAGAYDPSFNGSIDVALIKYNPKANGAAALVWATYLGGAQTDAPHRLVTTARGEVVVLGSTSSADFPTTDGAFDRQFHGGPAIRPDGIELKRGADLFVARLSASGEQLLASTYLGGSKTDGFVNTTATGTTPTTPTLAPYINSSNTFSGGLQVDATGDVYVASTTASTDFAGAAPANPPSGGTTNAVVLRLAADLRTVRWQQPAGGFLDDAAYDLALNPAGTAVYVCGSTYGPSFLATPGTYAPAAPGKTDGFVLRLAAADGRLAAACRLGTDQDDQALLLALDAAGNVVVTGVSAGSFAISPGHYGLPGGNFLVQFDPDLRQLQYSTTLGSYDADGQWLAPVALGVDACDQVYVAAVGSTAGSPVSYPLAPATASSFYAMRLSAGARSLDYTTRLPGDHVHGHTRFDGAGRLYLAVCGNCNYTHAFAVPSGVNTYSATSYAPTSRCNDASLLADLSAAATGLVPPLGTTLCVGAGPLALGGSPAGGTWAGPGVTGSLAIGYVFTPSLALVGVQQLTYQPPAGSAACAGTGSLQLTVALPTAVTFAPLGGPYCVGAGRALNIPLQAQPTGGYFSGPHVRAGSTASTYFAASEAQPGTYTLTYTLPGIDGRCGAATQTITVAGTPLVLSPDTTLCGEPYRAFQLRAQPAGGTWSGPGTSATGWFDPALVPFFNQGVKGGQVQPAYTYQGPDGCPTVRTVSIFKVPPPLPSQLLVLPGCPVAPGLAGYAPFTLRLPTLPSQSSSLYSAYTWDYGDGSGSGSVYTKPDSLHVYTRPGTYAPVLVITYGSTGTCTRTIRYAPFTVGEAPLPPNIITPNADGLNDTFVQRQFCEPPRLRVFSRWGQQVYQHPAYANDWGGQGLPAGLYYYLLSDNAGQYPAVKGWLEIVP